MKPVEKKTHRQLQYELARKERRLKTEACKRWRKRLKERLTELSQEATQTLVAFELPEGHHFPIVSSFSAICHVWKMGIQRCFYFREVYKLFQEFNTTDTNMDKVSDIY